MPRMPTFSMLNKDPHGSLEHIITRIGARRLHFASHYVWHPELAVSRLVFSYCGEMGPSAQREKEPPAS